MEVPVTRKREEEWAKHLERTKPASDKYLAKTSTQEEYMAEFRPSYDEYERACREEPEPTDAGHDLVKFLSGCLGGQPPRLG